MFALAARGNGITVSVFLATLSLSIPLLSTWIGDVPLLSAFALTRVGAAILIDVLLTYFATFYALSRTLAPNEYAHHRLSGKPASDVLIIVAAQVYSNITDFIHTARDARRVHHHDLREWIDKSDATPPDFVDIAIRIRRSIQQLVHLRRRCERELQRVSEMKIIAASLLDIPQRRLSDHVFEYSPHIHLWLVDRYRLALVRLVECIEAPTKDRIEVAALCRECNNIFEDGQRRQRSQRLLIKYSDLHDAIHAFASEHSTSAAAIRYGRTLAQVFRKCAQSLRHWDGTPSASKPIERCVELCQFLLRKQSAYPGVEPHASCTRVARFAHARMRPSPASRRQLARDRETLRLADATPPDPVATAGANEARLRLVTLQSVRDAPILTAKALEELTRLRYMDTSKAIPQFISSVRRALHIDSKAPTADQSAAANKLLNALGFGTLEPVTQRKPTRTVDIGELLESEIMRQRSEAVAAFASVVREWLARPSQKRRLIVTHGFSYTVRDALLLDCIRSEIDKRPQSLSIIVLETTSEDYQTNQAMLNDTRRMVHSLRHPQQEGSATRGLTRAHVGQCDLATLKRLIAADDALLVVLGAEAFDLGCRVVHPRGVYDLLQELDEPTAKRGVPFTRVAVAESYKYSGTPLQTALIRGGGHFERLGIYEVDIVVSGCSGSMRNLCRIKGCTDDGIFPTNWQRLVKAPKQLKLGFG